MFSPTHADDAFQLHINTADDDLDRDNAGTPSPKKGRRSTGAIPKKMTTPKSARKQKLSVAGRISVWATPTINIPKSRSAIKNTLINDDIFSAKKEKADREVEAAEQMLIHAHRNRVG